jgi:hypothetical protein
MYQGPADPTLPRHRKFGGRALLLGLATAVLVVLGGGIGTYYALTRHDSTPPLVGFGSLIQLDPCLVPAQSIGGSDMEVRIQPVGFSKCDYEVRSAKLPGEIDLELTVNPSLIASGSMLPSAVHVSGRSGNVLVAKEIPSPHLIQLNSCNYYVFQHSDIGVTIGVTTKRDDDDSSGSGGGAKNNDASSTGANDVLPGVDPCRIANQAAAAILTEVQQHNLPQIHYPADSAGSIDLCKLLSLPEVNTLLRTHGADAINGPHSCYWVSDIPSISLNVKLVDPSDWNGWPGGYGSPRLAPRSQVAGRETLVTGNSGKFYEVATLVKFWPSWPGRRAPGGPLIHAKACTSTTDVCSTDAPALVEEVTVTVEQDNDSEVSLTDATTAVVAKIWPRLPREEP